MAKRPVSALGNRRPISEFSRMASAMGGNPKYKVTDSFISKCFVHLVKFDTFIIWNTL